jgi:hypothetical protein
MDPASFSRATIAFQTNTSNRYVDQKYSDDIIATWRRLGMLEELGQIATTLFFVTLGLDPGVHSDVKEVLKVRTQPSPKTPPSVGRGFDWHGAWVSWWFRKEPRIRATRQLNRLPAGSG